MSVTVSDVMRLPSMVGAEVVAGAQGLNNPVESVTVLEYGYTSDLLDQLFALKQALIQQKRKRMVLLSMRIVNTKILLLSF